MAIDLRQIAGRITRTHLIAAGVLLAVLGIGYFAGGRGTSSVLNAAPPAPPPLPVSADIQLTAEQRQEAEFYARAAMLYVFFHEAGHMAISELKIPATGPEEDVVDEFAAFALTDALKAAPDDHKNFFASIVWGGIKLQDLWSKERDVADIDWADEHSPSQRRFYSMLCIATGADPLRFIPTAVSAGVDQSRLQRCDVDYKTKYAAWNTLMKPHARGFWDRVTGSGRLKLQVGEAMKPEWLAFEKAWTNGDFFQQLLDGMSDSLALPRDIPVIVKGCGKVNAWWSPSQGTITLCHDYFARAVDMFARDQVARANPQQQQAGGGGGTPAPAPGPAAPVPSVETLAGTWVCQGQTAAGLTREDTRLMRDGTFTSSSRAANFMMQASGRWSLQGTNTISYHVTSSSLPVPVNPIVVPFQMTGPNTMTASGLACQKTGA